MTNPTEIDNSAPVVVRHSITIDAPVDRVWKLHVDINRWTHWQHDITEVDGMSPVAVGNEFTWTSFGFTVTSTVYGITPGARLLWGGEADGILGIHEWLFQPTPEGTLVSTAESFAGEPVEAARNELKSQLDFSLTSWLQYLKAAAENQPSSK